MYKRLPQRFFVEHDSGMVFSELGEFLFELSECGGFKRLHSLESCGAIKDMGCCERDGSFGRKYMKV